MRVQTTYVSFIFISKKLMGELLAHALRVRLWLQADIQPPEIEVRFASNSRHSEAHAGLPLLTQLGHRGYCNLEGLRAAGDPVLDT